MSADPDKGFNVLQGFRERKEKGLRDVDVVVIGAGPAGSVTAGAIAEKGHSVALIERDSFPGETNVCGGTTPLGVAQAFDIPGQVIERKLGDVNCYFPENSFSFRVDFASFQRCVFDRYLAERAVSKGAELSANTIATGVSTSGSGAKVTLKSKKTGETRDVASQLVVFADGPDTLAAKVFPGVGFQRRPARTMHGLLYELEWPDNPMDSLDFYFDMKIVPWGYGWVFPKKDIINAGICGIMAASRTENTGMRHRLDYFMKEKATLSADVAGRKISRIQAAIIPVEPAARIYARRALLVGDAAGMVEPFSAGGNEFAMRAGLMAAKAASDALREGDYSDRSLSRYQSAWKRSHDSKTLTTMQRLLWLGWVYRKLDRKSAVKVYSYVFHKVAEEARKYEKLAASGPVTA